MLLSLISYEATYSFQDTNGSFQLDPGYYSFEIIGAKGGSCCAGRKGIQPGGNPAKITGQFKIKDHTMLKIVAGSKPVPHRKCQADISQYQNLLQTPGNNGEGGTSGDARAGAGGGYSSISINDRLLAMAGGGGGSGYLHPGGNAGGFKVVNGESISYQYLTNNDSCKGTHTVDRKGTSSTHKGETFTTSRSKDASILFGAGGGGGYFGGAAGRIAIPARLDDLMCYQAGIGGSSWVDVSSLLTYSVTDGAQNIHDGHGIVTITNLTVCGADCIDCQFGNGDHCTRCKPRYFIFENSCYQDCHLTPTPTYKSSDTQCTKCMENCKYCSSGSKCDLCIEGYKFDGKKCIKDEASQESKHSETAAGRKSSASNIDIDHEKGGAFGDGGNGVKSPKNDDKPFEWWIIGAIAGGAVLIAAVIGIVACIAMRRKEVTSTEMEEEEAEEFHDTTTTAVTTDYPLYSSHADDEDPFKNDFNSEVPKSTVFKERDIEEFNDNDVDAPDYDY